MSFQKPLDPPSLPKTQIEKAVWINNLDYFKILISRCIENNSLISTLRLENLTTESPLPNENVAPLKLISNLIADLKIDFKETEINQPLSASKVEKFNDSSKSIIATAFIEFSPLTHQTSYDKDFSQWFIHGEKTIMPKSDFTDHQPSSSINFDSFLAGIIANKIRKGISEIFFFNKTKIYTLKHEEVFEGIRKLNLSDDYIIVGFHQNITYYIDELKVEGLSNDSFQSNKIILFSNSNHEIVGNSFFIMRSEYLPRLFFKEIEAAVQQKYNLEVINDPFKIYSSVIDLYEHQELISEIRPVEEKEDLLKSVLVYLGLSCEVQWKNGIDCICIQTHNEFRERGVLNYLSDINSLAQLEQE